LPTASPTETVGDSAGVSDTSLFGSPGLNPSVFPSEMRLKKIHVIPPLQFPKKIFSPSVIPSVYTGGITDGCFPSVNFDRF
jgi:hypothetical protein